MSAKSFGELVGPVYSLRALAPLLGTTEEAVRKQIAQRELLALEVDGQLLLPTWQVSGTEVRPDAQEIISVLLNASDEFTAAQWFKTVCTEDQADRNHVQMLDAGERDAVRRCARETATRWAK